MSAALDVGDLASRLAPLRVWERVIDAIRQLPVMVFATNLDGICTLHVGGVLPEVGLSEGAGVGIDVRALPGLAAVWSEARTALMRPGAEPYRTTIAPGMEPGGVPAGSSRWAGMWAWTWTILRNPWSGRPVGLVCLALRLGDALEEGPRSTAREEDHAGDARD